jgi:hypothetical protein
MREYRSHEVTCRFVLGRIRNIVSHAERHPRRAFQIIPYRYQKQRAIWAPFITSPTISINPKQSSDVPLLCLKCPPRLPRVLRLREDERTQQSQSLVLMICNRVMPYYAVHPIPQATRTACIGHNVPNYVYQPQPQSIILCASPWLRCFPIPSRTPAAVAASFAPP